MAIKTQNTQPEAKPRGSKKGATRAPLKQFMIQHEGESFFLQEYAEKIGILASSLRLRLNRIYTDDPSLLIRVPSNHPLFSSGLGNQRNVYILPDRIVYSRAEPTGWTAKLDLVGKRAFDVLGCEIPVEWEKCLRRKRTKV